MTHYRLYHQSSIYPHRLRMVILVLARIFYVICRTTIHPVHPTFRGQTRIRNRLWSLQLDMKAVNTNEDSQNNDCVEPLKGGLMTAPTIVNSPLPLTEQTLLGRQSDDMESLDPGMSVEKPSPEDWSIQTLLPTSWKEIKKLMKKDKKRRQWRNKYQRSRRRVEFSADQK